MSGKSNVDVLINKRQIKNDNLSGEMKRPELIKRIIIIIPVLILIIGLGYIMIRSNAEKEYLLKISQMKMTAKDTSSQVDSCIASSNKPVPELLEDIYKLCKDSALGSDYEKLKTNESLKDIAKNTIAVDTDIEEVINDLGVIKGDVDKIKTVLKKNSEIDERINAERQSKDTYNNLIEENKKLKDENSSLELEIANMGTHERLKPVLSRISKAINYREKSIDAYYRALMTEIESNMAIQVYNDYVNKASAYVDSAKKYRVTTATARGALDTAREKEELANNNVDNITGYYKEAEEMLAKYRETMGFETKKPSK